MPAEGGRGTVFRELICGEEFLPFIPPMPFIPPIRFMPIEREPKFPALGGRGTERAPIAPVIGLELGLELLNPGLELLNAGPRFALAIPGRCVAPTLPGLETFELKPPRAAELKPPRFVVAARLTTGRENARDGGTAALVPLEPIMLARVGETPSE